MKINFLSYIKVSVSFYKAIGLDLISPKRQSSLLWNIFFYFGFINWFVFLVFQAIVLVDGSTGLIDTTAAVPCVNFGIAIFGKTISLCLQTKRFRRLLYEMENIYQYCARNNLQWKSKRGCKRVILIAKLFKWMGIVTGASSAFDQLVSSIIGWIAHGSFVYKTPFALWFSYDNISVWIFMALYANQLVVCFFSIVVISSNDMMLYQLVEVLCMFFDSLCVKFNDLQKSRNETQDLREIVRMHQILSRMCSEVNRIFKPSIWFNIAVASINLCMYLFQVTSGVTKSEFLRYVFLVGYQLQIVGIVCYLGSRLMEASAAVSIAAYGYYPYCNDVRCKKMLIRIIERAQQPCKLSAPPINEVSRVTFQTVISIAYQYFALLSTLKK